MKDIQSESRTLAIQLNECANEGSLELIPGTKVAHAKVDKPVRSAKR